MFAFSGAQTPVRSSAHFAFFFTHQSHMKMMSARDCPASNCAGSMEDRSSPR